MRCPKCKIVFKDNLKRCPFCKTKVSDLDVSSNDEFREHLELLEKMEDKLTKKIEVKNTNKKKRDNREVSLDKTIAIKVNVLNENTMSLMDEINKQIDSMNDSKSLEDKSYEDVIYNTEEELASLESFKKRRKVLVITSIASLTLIGIMILLLVITGNIKSNPNTGEIDYNHTIKITLDTYYETSEIDDLVYVMNDLKDNEEMMISLQDIVKNTCYGWVIRYKEEDVTSTKEFEEVTNNYKELINGIYKYAIVKNDDQYIRALTESDYDEIMNQFDQIYTDSLVFYEGLDLYNEKDYNKAYYMFGKVSEENPYYDKAVTYKNKIYENIIELINKDIIKISNDIDNLSDEEKLNIYIMIEETILEYNNVYNVSLSEYSEYQEILTEYTNKVSEYTDIVYNS